MKTPKLKDSSSTTLLALAVLCLTPGMIILSPDGRLFFLVLAGLVLAVVAVAAPSGKKRFAAGLGLLVAVVMALQTWPEYRAHAYAWKRNTSKPLESRGK